MVVVRAHDDDLVSSRGITPLEQRRDVARVLRLARSNAVRSRTVVPGTLRDAGLAVPPPSTSACSAAIPRPSGASNASAVAFDTNATGNSALPGVTPTVSLQCSSGSRSGVPVARSFTISSAAAPRSLARASFARNVACSLKPPSRAGSRRITRTTLSVTSRPA
jgi:hypothetical protein